MKLDLYGALGLNRDSPIGAVKGAYRRAAKAAHPDGGGSVEKFALVKLAHDTLSDSARRKRYDETGEAEEPRVEQTLNNAMELAFMTIQQVITEALQRGRDPEECDLISSAADTLAKKLRAMDQDVKNRKAQIKMAKSVAKRFRGKKNASENVFRGMWAAQLAAMEDGIRVATADRPKIELAIQLLEDHAFDAKRPEEEIPQGFIRFTQLGTAF